MKEALAKRIKKLELLKNTSFYLVADRGGFSRSYASEILKGNANPSLLVLAKISRGWELPLQDFFNDELFSKIYE